jgi:hypothetical protein
MSNETRRNELGAHLKKSAKPEAAKDIVNKIMTLINNA